MKKVCVFVWNDFKNDARVHRECTALIEAGYEVVLICLSYGDDAYPKEQNGVRIKRVNTSFYKGKNLLYKLYKYIVPIVKMISLGYKEDADAYHCNDLNTLLQGVFSSKCRVRKRKLIYDSHEIQTSRVGYGNKSIKFIEDVLIKFADTIITTTDTRADYLENLYHINRPVVLHNYPVYYDAQTIESIDLRTLYEIPREFSIILYQGGVHEGRGIKAAVEGMEYIEDAVLMIIGNGRIKSKLMEIVTEKRLDSKVRFVDTVPKEKLKNYTVSADIGLQLLENTCFNHYSSLSNKLIEYIMADLRIVVSDLPEMRQVVESKESCRLVKEITAENVALKINELIEQNRCYHKDSFSDEEKSMLSWEYEKTDYIKLFEGI